MMRFLNVPGPVLGVPPVTTTPPPVPPPPPQPTPTTNTAITSSVAAAMRQRRRSMEPVIALTEVRIVLPSEGIGSIMQPVLAEISARGPPRTDKQSPVGHVGGGAAPSSRRRTRPLRRSAQEDDAERRQGQAECGREHV